MDTWILMRIMQLQQIIHSEGSSMLAENLVPAVGEHQRVLQA